MKYGRLRFLSGLGKRLTTRLVLLMTAALLPLGALAMFSTAESLRTLKRGVEQAMATHVAESVSAKRTLIESGLGAAMSLRPEVLRRLGDSAACSSYLGAFIARSGIFSFAGFVGTDGIMRCVSQGGTLDLSASETFADLMARPRSVITATSAGPATGMDVVVITVPVESNDRLEGFLLISIPRAAFLILRAPPARSAPQSSIVFTRAGRILNIDESDDADLPGGYALADLTTSGDQVLHDRSREGEAAVYAVVELIPERLYALGMWPAGSSIVDPLRPALLPRIMPALMWVASLAVVLLSLHYLVLRHLRHLNRQMRRFALGQREEWNGIDPRAPTEFHELDGTFLKMAMIIDRDEKERESALAEKTVLLKEIHHRVKNNLQLISSIINLQMRQLTSPDAREVLLSVQERVLGLAGIHRALYQEHLLTELRADRVLDETIRRVVALGCAPSSAPGLTLDLRPLTLGVDQMVPLSFLVTEAITTACREDIGHPQGWIEVALHATPEDGESAEREQTVTLRITHSRRCETATGDGITDATDPGDTDTDASAETGRDLIAAFAVQLGATLQQSEVTDHARGPARQLVLEFPNDI